MAVLTTIWKEQTNDFSLIQKALLALILLFIFATSVLALGLVYLELQK
ncbi:MAG: hypothetical protein WBL27_11330 [Salinimicrobium sp.]